MEKLDYKKLAQLCREGDEYSIDLLTSHYYETVGKKYIEKNPNKENKEECAWKLCRLAVLQHARKERTIYKFSSHVNKMFQYKYQNYNMEDSLYEVSNQKINYQEGELLTLIKDAKNNQESFDKLYKKYYYLVEKYIKDNKDFNINKEKINELYKSILKKYINEEKTEFITSYIKSYLIKNVKKDGINLELDDLISKTPVLDLIEKAKNDKKYRNKLIEKYIYIVDKEAKEYPAEHQDEIKAEGYLKLVELIDNYLAGNVTVQITTYLINSIKHYYENNAKLIIDNTSRYIENIDHYQNMETKTEELIMIEEYFDKAGLTEREKDIIKKSIYEEITYREIAEMYGITFNRIGEIYKHAVMKLRYYAENEKPKKNKNKQRVGIYVYK